MPEDDGEQSVWNVELEKYRRKRTPVVVKYHGTAVLLSRDNKRQKMTATSLLFTSYTDP